MIHSGSLFWLLLTYMLTLDLVISGFTYAVALLIGCEVLQCFLLSCMRQLSQPTRLSLALMVAYFKTPEFTWRDRVMARIDDTDLAALIPDSIMESEGLTWFVVLQRRLGLLNMWAPHFEPCRLNTWSTEQLSWPGIDEKACRQGRLIACQLYRRPLRYVAG